MESQRFINSLSRRITAQSIRGSGVSGYSLAWGLSSKTGENWALGTRVAVASLGKVEKCATHGVERFRLSRKIVGVLERNGLHFAAGPVAVVPQSKQRRALLDRKTPHRTPDRYSDALAVVTDQVSVDWASEFLGPVGWSPGKHLGADVEQRPGFPQV